MEYIALTVTGLFFVASICQWLAWRTQLPAILYLILVGFFIGPVFGFFKPDEIFGDLLFPMTSLGVAIILFEGSLTLRKREIETFNKIIRNLCTIGVAVTWAGMSLAAFIFTSLTLAESFLFGAMVSVTGPTVIAPMLRSMQPTARIANILRWEGIVVDPIGAMLGLMVLVFIEYHQTTNAIYEVLKAFGLGSAMGLLSGMLLASIIRHHWVPEYLINLVSITIVLVSFTVSNHFIHESGLIAVTLMGIYLANQRDLVVEHILHFKEHLSVIIISMLFLILSARIELDAVLSIALSGTVVLLIAQFLVRPAAVYLSSMGTSTTKNERRLLSWIAPRGIVAAAISAVFAERLAANGHAGAETLVPLTFMIIIGTVIIQSATAKKLALKLKLSDAESQGVLIVSINRVSLAIAHALKKQGINVRMVDSAWDRVHEARMSGLDVFYGDLLSEKAEFNLDLSGMKTLISLSSNPQFNTLVCTHFKPLFDPNRLLTIANANEKESKLSNKHQYGLIFENEITWQKVASLLAQSWEVRATNLSKDYTIDMHREKWQGKPLLLANITSNGNLSFQCNKKPLNMGSGDNQSVALFLVPPKNQDEIIENRLKKQEQKNAEKRADTKNTL